MDEGIKNAEFFNHGQSGIMKQMRKLMPSMVIGKVAPSLSIRCSFNEFFLIFPRGLLKGFQIAENALMNILTSKE